MKDRRDGSADTSEEGLLRRWYVASSRAERIPTTELLSGAGRISRRHSTSRKWAVAVVAVVVILAAALFAGTWAGLRSSSSQPPAAMGSASATPSTRLTPTETAVRQATADGGPSLAKGEEVVEMGRTVTGGWLLTPARLLIIEGSSWRDCWLSGNGFGRGTLQAGTSP